MIRRHPHLQHRRHQPHRTHRQVATYTIYQRYCHAVGASSTTCSRLLCRAVSLILGVPLSHRFPSWQRMIGSLGRYKNLYSQRWRTVAKKLPSSHPYLVWSILSPPIAISLVALSTTAYATGNLLVLAILMICSMIYLGIVIIKSTQPRTVFWSVCENLLTILTVATLFLVCVILLVGKLSNLAS